MGYRLYYPFELSHVFKWRITLEHYQPLVIKENEKRWSNCENTSHRLRSVINNIPFWCDFDRASSLICGNKMPTRCNRWFLLQILLLAQHVSGTIIPIIRSSRVLYRWLLPVVFSALVFKLSVWCRAEGYVSGLQAAAAAYKPLCPSSGAREYYTDGCCLWYLVLWFSSCRYGVELRVMCPVCGRPQTGHIILSSSWWWA